MNGFDSVDWMDNSNLSQPMSLQQLAANSNFQLGPESAGASPVNATYMPQQMDISAASQQGADGVNAGVPKLSLEQIANINMLNQMGRQDLASQLMGEYGAKLPEESGFQKWSNILTGSPDHSLAGWEKGLQSALPLSLGLFKLLATNNYVKNNPGYMTGLAASQVPQLRAAVKK